MRGAKAHAIVQKDVSRARKLKRMGFVEDPLVADEVQRQKIGKLGGHAIGVVPGSGLPGLLIVIGQLENALCNFLRLCERIP